MQFTHLFRAGVRGNALIATGVRNGGLVSLHVLRQRKDDRAGTPRNGSVESVTQILRHAVGAGEGKDDKVYVRMSAQSNEQALAVDGQRFLTVREGRRGVVVAVGPLLDAVLAATEGLDVTVLYASTVRPFDSAALRRATDSAGADIVLVEPYLAGTSTAAANDALADVPHRVLGLGVGRRELRRYGQLEEHVAAHGLDAATLRERITGFVR